MVSEISGVYRQYKQDTDAVASWLASTARAHRCPPELLSSTAAPARPRGRAKGKERTKAREKTTQSSGGTRYIIDLENFEQLANFIARLPKTCVTIPHSFFQTLERLINLRSNFANLLHEHGQTTCPKSEQNHGHFVQVLQGVQSILGPSKPEKKPTAEKKPTRESGKSPEKASPSVLGSFENRFAALSVEEPSQSLLDAFSDAAAPAPRPPKQKNDQAVYEAKITKSTEEALFLYMALCRDLSLIRGYIHDLWRPEFLNLDHAAKAVATEVSMSFGRSLISEVEPILEEFGEIQPVLEGLSPTEHLSDCFKRGIFGAAAQMYPILGVSDWLDRGVQREGNKFYLNPPQDKCNLYFFNTMRALVDRLLPFITLGSIPPIVDPTELEYTSSKPRSMQSEEEKKGRDEELVVEMFSYMLQLSCTPAFNSYLRVEDSFLKDVRASLGTKTISFNLVFSAQVMLDIHHVMGETIHDVFIEAQREMDRMKSWIQSTITVLETWQADQLEDLMSKLRRLRRFRGDFLFFDENPIFIMNCEMLPGTYKEEFRHRMFMNWPVLTGLVLFDRRSWLRKEGMAVIGLHTLEVIHLCNALEKERLLSAPWKDIDWMLSTFGDSRFWIGQRSKNRTEYHEKLFIRRGGKLSTLAMLKRKGGDLKVCGLKIKPFRDNPLVSPKVPLTALRPPLTNATGAAESSSLPPDLVSYWTVRDIQELCQHASPSRKEKLKGIRMSFDASSEYAQRKAWDGTEVSILELQYHLRALAIVMTDEVAEMTFPFLKLDTMCMTLTRKIVETCDPVICRALYHYTTKTVDGNYRTLLNFFLVVCDLRMMEEGNKLLRIAADIVNKWLAEGNGEVCCAEASW